MNWIFEWKRKKRVSLSLSLSLPLISRITLPSNKTPTSDFRKIVSLNFVDFFTTRFSFPFQQGVACTSTQGGGDVFLFLSSQVACMVVLKWRKGVLGFLFFTDSVNRRKAFSLLPFPCFYFLQIIFQVNKQ